MPRALRFHLDEHCPDAIAHGLRRLGIDVTTTAEAGLLGAIDEVQLRYAHSQGRVILTGDEDYLTLVARGLPHAGVVYLGRGKRQVGDVIDRLVLIGEVYEPEEMAGRVEYL